jgi:hypothetical protein
MAANASAREHRRAVLESPLAEFSGWLLALDCGAPQCRRDRVYALAELAGMVGAQTTVGALLRRLRCHECGGRPSAVFLETGPELAARGRLRRVALTGPEERVRPDWP